MTGFLSRAISGIGLLLSTAVATAGPIVLDTEQKAAAGVATALITSERQPPAVNGVIDNVRDYAAFTLKTVAAATTPAALLSAPSGITIHCSISGTLEARMANALPRVLRVRWNDCVTRHGFVRTFNGPVAITLPADTFQPQSVTAIRFGNASGAFLGQWRTVSPQQNDDVTEAFSISLRGDISMTRLFSCCEWIGSSSFEMDGYYDLRRNVESPIGAPLVFTSYKLSAQQLTVVRSTNSADGVDEDDTRYVCGSVSVTQTQPQFGVWTEAFRFNEYHVQRITDFNAWQGRLTVDGKINATWSPFASAGCSNGWYSFRTRKPLVNALNTSTFESGELAVNGSVVAGFHSTANTPPGLPAPANGMLVSMRVRGVGTFNYDVAAVFDALTPAGQCVP